MEAAGSYKGVLKKYESCNGDLKAYFQHLPSLVTSNYPWEVLIAYLFMRVEAAHNRAIHGSVVKLHRANVEVVSSMLDSHRLTRNDVSRLLYTITDQELPKDLDATLKRAEGIRDRCVHGKSVSPAQARQAVLDVLNYAEGFNAHLKGIAGFEPFGDMRGYKGRLEPLDKSTTKWLLRGMGFTK